MLMSQGGCLCIRLWQRLSRLSSTSHKHLHLPEQEERLDPWNLKRTAFLYMNSPNRTQLGGAPSLSDSSFLLASTPPGKEDQIPGRPFAQGPQVLIPRAYKSDTVAWCQQIQNLPQYHRTLCLVSFALKILEKNDHILEIQYKYLIIFNVHRFPPLSHIFLWNIWKDPSFWVLLGLVFFKLWYMTHLQTINQVNGLWPAMFNSIELNK